MQSQSSHAALGTMSWPTCSLEPLLPFGNHGLLAGSWGLLILSAVCQIRQVLLMCSNADSNLQHRELVRHKI